MNNSKSDPKKAVESGANKVENNQLEKGKEFTNEQQTNQDPLENDYLVEQSFEVISPSSILEVNMESGEVEDQMNQQNVVGLTKERSNSVNHDSSPQQQRKKSGSFLSRLQSSVEDKEGANIQSSIANAFSSFSSFTSNFTLNSSINGNNSANSLIIETASTSTRLSQIIESKEEVFNKKAALERKNLISLTKLIVKDLISSSLSVSRTIDDCENTIHLTNYFTLIDRVLKHGLKQNLLSNRSASLWNALDSLPKYLKESTLMSESVRSLANTKTPDGKIKAWMRLAMMQKRLPEYFSELLANKNVLLKDIYHDFAFMLNDEAQVFAGLIIGVNVIDCNFFVKDAKFDLMDDIIELSPYLRVANSYDNEQEGEQSSTLTDPANITAVLDQKNYLEEWNKRLESNVLDLQAKIKTLEDQNSKLEMEAKLSEARILKLQGKKEALHDKPGLLVSNSSMTNAFKNLIGTNSDSKHTDSASNKAEVVVDKQKSNEQLLSEEVAEIVLEDKQEHSQDDLNQEFTVSSNSVLGETVSDSEIRLQLAEQEKELVNLKERASILEASYRSSLEKIKVLERDLDIQTSMNADKETTIKIYEKDIREKQAQVESLRVSMNESKKSNSDLNERLNDTNNKMKERVKTISHLQDSLVKWKLENKTLATRLQDKKTALNSITHDLEVAMKNVEELKKYNEKINEELRNERESGQSSSSIVETQATKISDLTLKIVILENQLTEIKPYKDENVELNKKCRDYELSLEEIGAQLRETRLELDNLKENSAVFLDSQWMDDKQIKSCALCQLSFSVTRRKHHCRLCGNVFCQTCSDNKMELASSSKPVRVCDTCHAFLLAKFVKSST